MLNRRWPQFAGKPIDVATCLGLTPTSVANGKLYRRPIRKRRPPTTTSLAFAAIEE